MRQNLYWVLLAALLLPALAQEKDKKMPPPPPPVGPNGPWVVTVSSKGDYKVAEAYTINDLVLHNGDRYVSMADQNQGNEPTPTSSLWMRLPDYKGAITVAGWGMFPTGRTVAVSMKGKHFKSATSYGCGMTSDLLATSAPEEAKAKFAYQSGEQFSVTGIKVSPAGYICAGN